MINALSEKYHPLQALADFMTVKVREWLLWVTEWHSSLNAVETATSQA